MAELGSEFPEVKKEGYDNKTLQKINFQNANGIKREMIQILQGCWRRLKLKSKKEHDLQRHEVRETTRAKALSDVEVIRRKEAKITKKEDNQEYGNSVYFTILSHKTLTWYQPIYQGMTENMFFSFRDSP